MPVQNKNCRRHPNIVFVPKWDHGPIAMNKSLPRRLMVGHQPLELSIVVRIHAGQQKESDKMGYGIFTDTCRILRY